ncbi:hypothetical protein SAMN06298216_3921 [Spirosomataceae bacterium TFI 002]|nr:hypothetical protein SAMN06298216_3921 [Spirosomataceae bacterium TFI 002]
MTNVKGSKYEIRVPKVNFNDGINEFKFVVNGNDWQPIPDDALNTQNGNLTFEME